MDEIIYAYVKNKITCIFILELYLNRVRGCEEILRGELFPMRLGLLAYKNRVFLLLQQCW